MYRCLRNPAEGKWPVSAFTPKRTQYAGIFVIDWIVWLIQQAIRRRREIL